jgi:predicted DNA-binding transcriptional regulator YafY
MTKSERLVHHLRLMRTRRVVSIPQLCEACDVTPRTIYRDMTTLTKLNIPVYFDNGYRLEKDDKLPLREFDADDLELLCFCLRNNPLAEYDFFARRFRLLESKVAEKLTNHSEGERRTFFHVESSAVAPVKESESRILQRFLRALSQRNKIELIKRGGSPRRAIWLPVGVTISSDSLSLAMLDRTGSLPTEIPIADIKEIRITATPFDSAEIADARAFLQRGKKELTAIAG